MNDQTSALSMILESKILTSWCEQLEHPDLSSYIKLGGFQGLDQVLNSRTTESISELSASGLTNKTSSAELIATKLLQFQDQPSNGVLVVDAHSYDPQAQSAHYLLAHNPYAFVEGLYIIAELTGCTEVLLLLPHGMPAVESRLFNSLDEAARTQYTGDRNIQLKILRDPPYCLSWESQRTFYGDNAFHLHLETLYHLVLIFSLGSSTYNSLMPETHSGTTLVTISGQVQYPGLIEISRGANLWQTISIMAGGPLSDIQPFALSLDDGMGGFLPVHSAQLPLEPEGMVTAGVTPSPDTITLLADQTCMVDMARRALYHYWLYAENEPSEVRQSVAQAVRMVTELTVGHGKDSHISELEQLGRDLRLRGVDAAWPLLSSLFHFRNQWQEHLEHQHCAANVCFRNHVAPCHNACPANIDIPSFMAHVGNERYHRALEILVQDNPMPYVCGLICPAPCEQVCLRGEMDKPIHIRNMKTIPAMHALESTGYPEPQTAPSSGKSVAIVGAGPAGLSAAYYLSKQGHQVTIHESQSEPGGVLRYGIPSYRLPKDVLKQEVQWIQEHGVTIHTASQVHNVNELREEGYDAIFLALGTHVAKMLPIEGIDQPFVLKGLDFLKDAYSGKDVQVGPKVVVVGGGNVAIDVALTASRLGAEQVELFCLEKRREMPASEGELQPAIEEGITIHNGWGPLRVTSDQKFTVKRCLNVFDEQGNFRPEFDPEDTMTVDMDHIIFTIGQDTDVSCVEQFDNIEVQRGFICTRDETLQTGEKGVFAGGDVVYGTRTVVEAIRAGKQAATSIHAYLLNEQMDPAWDEPRPRDMVAPLRVPPSDRMLMERPHIPERDVEERKNNFDTIELGLNDEMASIEARRCLRCDLCIGCGLCQFVCSEFGVEALRLEESKEDRFVYHDFLRPSSRCVGCGACALACPTGAIVVQDEARVRRTVLTGSPVCEQDLLTCSHCGKTIMSQRYYDYLKSRISPQAIEHVDIEMCSECSRRVSAEEIGS